SRRRRRVAKTRSVIPNGCVRLLGASQSVEELLMERPTRTLGLSSSASGNQVHLWVGAPELLQELGQLQVRQPRIEDEGLRNRIPGFCPCLRATIDLRHLPTQPQENGCNPLAEAL